ncbi:MAG: hypothetical protein ACREP6_11240 [Candidatus Binataceae bacterium]
MDKREFIAWVKLPSPEEIRQMGLPPSYNFGFVGAMGRLLVAHPKIGPHFNKLFGQIMFAPGVLSRPEREMVAMVTARAQECFY